MNAESLQLQPKLRVYAIEILLILGVLGYLFHLLNLIPERDFYLSRIVVNFFGIKNEWLREKTLSALRYKITPELIQTIKLGIIGSGLATVLFFWVKVKSTTISMTNKYMEIESGILSRTQDNLDMIDIRDQSLYRNVINRLIGVSVVHIISADKTHPNLFLKLGKAEATLMMDFLKVHSTRSIVDYQLTRDMKGSRGRMRKTDESNEGSDR